MQASALITGASSGIGRDMAHVLSGMGYRLYLVARREDRLNELIAQLPGPAEAIALDLSVQQNCIELHRRLGQVPLNVMINNAGFGLYGAFDQTDLDAELAMIDLNIKAMHTLFKLFLQDFIVRDAGYLMNVASSAAFSPGPQMATYYATKAYVLHLTQAVYQELKMRQSHVSVSVLCPGPVATEFEQKADVHFNIKNAPSMEVAQYAIRKMFERQLTIVPGALMKASKFAARLAPDKMALKVASRFQQRLHDK